MLMIFISYDHHILFDKKSSFIFFVPWKDVDNFENFKYLIVMNFIGKIQNEYEHLWKQIVKPPRVHYSEESLGPSNFNLEGI